MRRQHRYSCLFYSVHAYVLSLILDFSENDSRLTVLVWVSASADDTDVFVMHLYTMNHKKTKRDILFLTITLANFNRFL